MANGARGARRARRAASVRGGSALTKHALNVLRGAGIKYRQTGSAFRTTRTTILGKGRKPRYVFPKARWKWARLSY